MKKEYKLSNIRIPLDLLSDIEQIVKLSKNSSVSDVRRSMYRISVIVYNHYRKRGFFDILEIEQEFSRDIFLIDVKKSIE